MKEQIYYDEEKDEIYKIKGNRKQRRDQVKSHHKKGLFTYEESEYELNKKKNKYKMQKESRKKNRR